MPAKLLLVVGDKVYKISNPKSVAKYIGDKVTVTLEYNELHLGTHQEYYNK